jgi:DNA polymerase-3 subunit gamma/tau
MRLGSLLRDQVGLVSYVPGALALRPLRPLGNDFPRDLAAAAKDVTGTVWTVNLADTGGEPSLQEQAKMADERDRAAVLEESVMVALLAAFPDATLESVTPSTQHEATHAQSR